MGQTCREITNSTDAIFQQNDALQGMTGQIGRGYSSAIYDSNILLANPTTMKESSSIRDNVVVMVNPQIIGNTPDPEDKTDSSLNTVVIKRIRNWGNSHDENAAMDFVRELRVLTHAPIRTHPNIISLTALRWTFWPGESPDISPTLYLESSKLGDLAIFQQTHNLTYKDKKQLFLDVSLGLEALHNSGIVHGDVKSENVLVFRNQNGYLAKLCDFGFSILLADIEGNRARLRGGTIPWTAPEFGRDLPCPQVFLKLTDVYSLGLLFWRVLLDGKNPFSHLILGHNNNTEQLKNAVETPLLSFVQLSILLRPEYNIHAFELCSLLACMIQKHPLKRKLQAAIKILNGRKQSRHGGDSVQLSSNILDFTENGFILQNVCVPVRLKILKYMNASAIKIQADMKGTFLGANPVMDSLVNV